MPRVEKQKSTSKSGSKPVSVSYSGQRGFAIELPSAWDFVDTIKANLYGRSATGKTTLWATFPGPILAIVVSGGCKPGELKSINTPEYRKKIDARVVNSTDQINSLIDKGNDYATVVLDHATGMQDLKLKEILGIDELPAQLSWGLATQQQYGQLALQMKETLRALLNLNSNVVIVAQQREFNTESDSELLQPYVASALTPSVVGWLMPACDVVCQTFVRPQVSVQTVKVAGQQVKTEKATGKVEYCLRTYPSPIYASKFRVPKGSPLPECIVDPTYDKLIKLIQGGG